jgi:succinate dehydrogenase / fumarate reductase, flavoprotein subunit
VSTVERQSWDVVVVGAGGAGLRAAIEAREQGLRTAVVCKSLFGKAHTVMAEGGIAAAMGNVNAGDNWQVHFRDTLRGGKFLNHWRMAELHAQEAPQRVWSWRRGARSSTAPRTAGSRSGTSAGTSTRGWRTSATAPVWN